MEYVMYLLVCLIKGAVFLDENKSLMIQLVKH